MRCFPNLRSVSLFLFCFTAFVPPVAHAQQSKSKPVANGGDFSNATDAPVKVPAGVILVKGAWSSATDSLTPVPEGGTVANNVFDDSYFGIRYPLPEGWSQKYEGPPPSDSGRYVLAQIRPADRKANERGTVLITAQDMFFTPLPSGAMQLANYVTDHLQTDYKLEQPPTEIKIAGHSFAFLAYWSPVAQLHWYVMDTQIRCHTLEIVLTSQDTKLLGRLLVALDKMTLPAEAGVTGGMGGGSNPVCIKNYASGRNIVARVEPVFSDAKFNPVPVRIIIDKKGRVKHIHFLSAFPEQAKVITDALAQWRFQPYFMDGQPVEVETGMMFGRGPHLTGSETATE